MTRASATTTTTTATTTITTTIATTEYQLDILDTKVTSLLCGCKKYVYPVNGKQRNIQRGRTSLIIPIGKRPAQRVAGRLRADLRS